MNESVIMNINPTKFEKPKDHLFFNFFAMYAKNSVEPNKNYQANHFDGVVLVSTEKENKEE